MLVLKTVEFQQRKISLKKTSASLQVSITSGQREKIRKNNYGGLGDGMRCQKQ